MSARRVSIGDVGDMSAPPGTRPWAVAVRLELLGRYHEWQNRRDSVLRLIEGFDRHGGWRQLERQDGSTFESVADFLAEPAPFGLGYDEERVRIVMESREQTQARAEHIPPLAAMEETGRGHKTSDNYQKFSEQAGTGANYLTARIARDHPAILERMKAGEFRSVRAAAIEAGIVKPEARLSMPADVDGLARALRRRLTTEQLADLIALLMDHGRAS